MFKGAAGNRLVADVYGDGGQPVMLLHGGGQTRHAWRRTAEHLGRAGATAYSLDQRGHGDSEWVTGGHYAFTDFAADAAAVAATLTARGGKRPIAIGASLGGIASLLAEGEADKAGTGPVFASIVLVDITPRVNREGVAKIQGFMRERAGEGFTTDCRSSRRGRGVSAAPAAPALARGVEEEFAAAPRWPLALALGSGAAQGRALLRDRSPHS